MSSVAVVTGTLRVKPTCSNKHTQVYILTMPHHSHTCIIYFGHKMADFPLQNNPKNLDPSYKMNEDFFIISDGKHLKPKLNKTDPDLKGKTPSYN